MGGAGVAVPGAMSERSERIKQHSASSRSADRAQRGSAMSVVGFDDSRLARLLKFILVQSPSYSLRGGTPEVLRGIIARGLGLR